MKRRLIGAAATAAAALVLASCSGGSGDDSTDDSGLGGGDDGDGGGSLTLADVELYKQYNTGASDASLYDDQFDRLLNDRFNYYDSDLNLQQDEDFGTYEKTSDDPLTVEYTINADRNWSDGTPVTATSMLLSWAALSGQFNTVEEETDEEGDVTNEDELDEGVFFNSTSPGISFIEDAEVSDDNKTITFTYSKPYADWELNFDTVGVPAHVVGMHALDIDDPAEADQAVADAINNDDREALSKISTFWNEGFQFDTTMPEDESLYLSNGRFALTDWQDGQYQTFERRDDYQGPNPAGVDTLTVRKLNDGEAMVQALENGEIDGFATQQVNADLVANAEGLGDDYTVEQGEAGAYGHIDLTFTGGGPFDPETYGGDEAKALAVRQAFLKVLPRQEIMDKLVKPLNPDAELRDSFTQVPGAPWYDDIVAASGVTEYDEQDVDAAKQLLEQAGVDTPVSVRFLFSNESPERAEQFTIISNAMDESGLFTAEDHSDADWAQLKDDPTGYDATIFGWISTGVAVTESDANFRTGAVNNSTGYTDEEVDDLLDQLSVETDEDAQEQLLTDVETHVVDAAFGMPFSQDAQLTVVNNRVSGIDTMSISPTIYWNPWDWSVSGSE